MGGRGTFAAGNPVAYTYENVGKIEGVKIIEPIDKSRSFSLPAEAHSSSSYVLLDKDGVFHQYREYNAKHEVILEIGYHHEPALGKGDVLHIHIHDKPGVENHNNAEKRKLTRNEYNKYKRFLKGVVINEGEYFGTIH